MRTIAHSNNQPDTVINMEETTVDPASQIMEFWNVHYTGLQQQGLDKTSLVLGKDAFAFYQSQHPDTTLTSARFHSICLRLGVKEVGTSARRNHE